MRTRSKICGITSVADAKAACDAGADAIGLVFYKKSPRYVKPEVARAICETLPPFVTAVGLFVDMDRDVLESILEQVPLGLLQFHGAESEPECLGYKLPYIKAVRVRSCADVENAERDYPSAQGLLVDTYREGVPGGTGEVFDWELLPSKRTLPLILAGGLNPDNVRNAIRLVKPFAVDVSGGVERAKGIKDHAKVLRFLNEVS